MRGHKEIVLLLLALKEGPHPGEKTGDKGVKLGWRSSFSHYITGSDYVLEDDTDIDHLNI